MVSAGSCSPIRGRVFRSRSWSGCSSPSSRAKNGELGWGWRSADALWNSMAGSSWRPTAQAAAQCSRWSCRSSRRRCSENAIVEGHHPASCLEASPMPKLLIIDDESSIRLSIKAVFARDGTVCHRRGDGRRRPAPGSRAVSRVDPARHQARQSLRPRPLSRTAAGRSPKPRSSSSRGSERPKLRSRP